jgi:phosphate transport system permease protein
MVVIAAVKFRNVEERIFKLLMVLSLVVVLSVFATIIVVIFLRGASALNLEMLTQVPTGGYYLGGKGGIANAIVGSVYLALGATLLAIAVSLPLAFALQREYLGRRLAHLTRLSLDVLWGTPSIVYGAIGFLIMLQLHLGASLLGGIVTLAFLIMPIMVRGMDEVIRRVPGELKEISYSMGTTRTETSFRVVLRQVMPGIVMAVLLAFGRAIGDAASVLFTAGYTDSVPQSLFDPAASLPLAVFFQLGSPVVAVQQRAYASAFVLLLVVLAVSMASRLFNRQFSKFVVK